MTTFECSNSNNFETFQLRKDQTWEVRANNRRYHTQVKEPFFLCFKTRKYAGNEIKTSKYNVVTFLPRNLFEQFQRVANFYYLLIVILQAVPAITTLPWYTTMIPLTFVLGITAVKDLIDDIARHKSDKEINNRPCDVLVEKSFTIAKWKELQVGDVVCLKKDDFVPADLFLLSSSEPNSLCYVETAEIDGETNLKYRQALSVTHDEVNTVDQLARFDGRIICEKPNCDLHSFTGTLFWKGQEFSLDNEQILLRGCRIRNTEKCYGVVLFAGVDTKIMKNSGRYILKKTRIERLMNRVVFLVLLILAGLSFCLAAGGAAWDEKFGKKAPYLDIESENFSPGYRGFLSFWGYVIILNSILPMSLYVTFELLHVVQSFFINWDIKMYCDERDSPAKARTTTLNEELGQIKYIFSDKTGTLTQNIMTFKKCSIGGRIYGNQFDDVKNAKVVDFSWNTFADEKLKFYDCSLLELIRSGDDPGVHEFFKLLAVCHTVMVEAKDGQLTYQAASPDEEALVTAARNFGYVFLSRTQDTITISELGVQRTYTVLAMLDFNSFRKRMSVILEDSEGKIKLYSKGADAVIYERLCPNCPHKESTQMALDYFAAETLRTLCLAYKEVEESYFKDWNQRHHKASVILQNRGRLLDELYEEIERDLVLIGATAIEDKLQDGVPETIQNLKEADIKIWVLTGDKKETAINIGYSCKLLSDRMVLFDGHDISKALEKLQKSNYMYKDNNIATISGAISNSEQPDLLSCDNKALIITGSFLNKFTRRLKQSKRKKTSCWKLRTVINPKSREEVDCEEEAHERAFVELACLCKSVICCRVTPKQKAMVVQLVKKYKNAITLAIGDGANDVNMLKTAHIGVGISGQEGMQAVLSSDYSLAQFRYLERLLLVHGRWSYLRICKFLRYFLYKTFTFSFVQIWFAFFSGFSGLSVFEKWCISFYKVAYSWLPVLLLGALDQDISDKLITKCPKLYKIGQCNELFNYRIFLITLFHGLLSSVVIFFIPYGAFLDTTGKDGIAVSDYQSLSTTIGTAVVISVNIEVMLEISYWTVPTVLSIIISLALYFCITFLTQSTFLTQLAPDMFQFHGAALNIFKQPYVWLTILLTIAVNFIPSITIRLIWRVFHSKTAGRATYENLNKSQQTSNNKATHFRRGSTQRRSAYAFSQDKGYADLITSGASIRKKRPASGTNTITNTFSQSMPEGETDVVQERF
ncbi:phospholipid-transporting ATPase IC isoform X1 [Chiloscyllium plagiosum]|uniref:phospholipid-transporting ATPase IC isoform X1 n=1 Tax=Chiloscyllium plagiosum TaxID=36176 RepID=UPI001CB7FB32|nr:phospholipid-transporting ATPase IC isoform X1 [Chiloscyllium plagiosum]XP_043577098.1 phospholipid-transporting ATPase IC isoform X1 [Chiloscyllium plagiosum]XP_043577099.1 phospholipid-transporting ATPase IC isoform X1 [Chiloscyllium plagiosum]XP_043577100.1 phospholipid-transporting ATPase IC isoform X1 [Chiloscyllium plagiosum]XP_043577101.1 phospholipid-transporting ATPase IC isoform X1 [Chiloscyllium plagiosum]XP_043577102.1 phospholipid-transporting ATPase IC isoform X1 [Chiloscylliu